MDLDTRDQIWKDASDTYYQCYFQEIAAEHLIRRLQIADEVTKVLVAITASGTAISGWALWSQPGFRQAWAALAGIAAILAIVHATLGISNRLRDWDEYKRTVATLRIDVESFRQRMSLDANFPIRPFSKQLEDFRNRYAIAFAGRRSDLPRTKRLRIKAQRELDVRIADQTIRPAE